MTTNPAHSEEGKVMSKAIMGVDYGSIDGDCTMYAKINKDGSLTIITPREYYSIKAWEGLKCRISKLRS
jgi:hypothetical protein